MQRALELAERGRGWVEPNPLVGAVLVREGRVVAEGWHGRYGGPHAEVEALRDAEAKGLDARGLTLAVTLEPCSHHGKTPPCTDAVIAAGLSRVVVAMQDPFEDAAGRGVARLRERGIEVVVGVCEREARRQNEAYLKRVTTGLPWVTLKWAQTLDGRIATAAGDSKWISSEGSRRRVHELRGRVDAVMTGIGTVLADDPTLTARDVEVRRVARRVVVDPMLRIPREAAVLREPEPPVTVAIAADAPRGQKRRALEARGVEVVELGRRADGRCALRPLLSRLSERHGATNVLVEGGARLMGSLLDQGLADRVLAFVAPRVLGQDGARAAVSGLLAERISDARPLELRSIDRIGDDVLLDYRVIGD